MKKLSPPNLYVLLTHYPVVNKNGEVVASAVTNLDLHDIARAARTYGVRGFYVVTPLSDQKALIEKIVTHWTRGTGSRYNPKRREALELVRIEETLADVMDHITACAGEVPKTVVTSARWSEKTIGYGEFKEKIGNGEPFLLIFGTAWGLSEEILSGADFVLAPIQGGTPYNHLSVRSAAAIILDRLMGRE